MDAQEMHIEIDLELQKLNSQVTKNILPEEKDWFLNNEVLKFIKQRTDPLSNRKNLGFEETAKRVEDIKDLIRVKNSYVELNTRGEYFTSFPSNYLHYIRFDAFMQKTCNITKSKDKTTLYNCVVNLSFPTTILENYSITLTPTIGDTIVLFNSTDLPSNYIINSEISKQYFILKKALKIKLEEVLKENLSPNSQIYWEKDNTIHIESDISFTNIFITKTNEEEEEGEDVVLIYTPVQKIMESYSVEKTPLKAKVRVISEVEKTDIENSNLSKSQANSPIAVIQQDFLKFSKLESVVFGSVDITYICKPSLIDVNLNSSLNMSTNVCKEIVSNTIRFIKGLVQSDNYNTYVKENILIE